LIERHAASKVVINTLQRIALTQTILGVRLMPVKVVCKDKANLFETQTAYARIMGFC